MSPLDELPVSSIIAAITSPILHAVEISAPAMEEKVSRINKVVVALANKLARVAWVILTRPGALYEHRDPQFG